MSSGYRQVDHTADIALELWAPTIEGLFVQGALGVIDVLTEGRTIRADTERKEELEAADREEGLVVWLNEVLYWAVTGGFIFAEGAVELDGERIRVVAKGQEDGFDAIATELKSVTYHDLALVERDGGWFARVVIDV